MDVIESDVEFARAAAVEVGGPDAVGESLGVSEQTEDDGATLITHLFASRQPGYVGWHWAVTVARAAGADVATVDEVVLLPGDGALLAPVWVPWSDRLQPGDLGVGDIMPTPADDPRLDPGWSPVGDEVDSAVEDEGLFWEFGLGRARVLSLHGRDEAAFRWYEGDAGPDSPHARVVDVTCSTCGFLVLMGGALGRTFGVCANEYAPDDGHVVSFDHGCGAHSELLVLPNEPQAVPPPEAVAPAADSPVAESPVAESPAAESPAAESPVAESPVAESPAEPS